MKNIHILLKYTGSFFMAFVYNALNLCIYLGIG